MEKLQRLKKYALAFVCALALASPCAAVTVGDALEACRHESGLLPDVPGGETFSSAVLVQEMQLRYLQGDRERFADAYALMKDRFQSRLMLMYRQLDKTLSPVAFENRVSTDLSACMLLMKAGREWDVPEYVARAEKIAGRIRKFNVYREVLLDGASWSERKSGIFRINEVEHVLHLASVDAEALHGLQSRFPEWEAVAQRSLGILLAGAGGESVRTEYVIDRRRYGDGTLTPDDELIITANLIKGGLIPVDILRRLTEKLAAEPRWLVDGGASLRSAVLAVHALRSAGQTGLARSVENLIESELVTESGLLCAKGEKPDVLGNLMWLTVRAQHGLDADEHDVTEKEKQE